MINVMLLFVNTHHKKNKSRYAICFQNIHCVVLSINEQIRHRSKLQIVLEGSLPSAALQCSVSPSYSRRFNCSLHKNCSSSDCHPNKSGQRTHCSVSLLVFYCKDNHVHLLELWHLTVSFITVNVLYTRLHGRGITCRQPQRRLLLGFPLIFSAPTAQTLN